MCVLLHPLHQNQLRLWRLSWAAAQSSVWLCVCFCVCVYVCVEHLASHAGSCGATQKPFLLWQMRSVRTWQVRRGDKICAMEPAHTRVCTHTLTHNVRKEKEDKILSHRLLIPINTRRQIPFLLPFLCSPLKQVHFYPFDLWFYYWSAIGGCKRKNFNHWCRLWRV